MAYTLEASPQGEIDLDEFMEFVSMKIDLTDEDSLLSAAPMLSSLAENRSLVADRLRIELCKFVDQNDRRADYSPHSFPLASRADFYVRANVWEPLRTQDCRHRELESRLFSYLDAHDHNFDFMTVGYSGSGYRTELFEYDNDRVIGYIGERVDIRFLEETTLPRGKVMFYRRSKDIHIQHPPQQTSISLNLMVSLPITTVTSQFYFDIPSSTISGYSKDLTTRRSSLLRLAALVDSQNFVEPISHIASTHQCPKTRSAAYSALGALLPDEADRLLKLTAADSHSLVRTAGLQLAL